MCYKMLSLFWLFPQLFKNVKLVGHTKAGRGLNLACGPQFMDPCSRYVCKLIEHMDQHAMMEETDAMGV